ncbi:mitochondrial inner membrane protein OXA1L [Bacillus rossius redtenbacheri]|uniref:mitochondrial inner membrane protein OXA1L n=1 Tax=Bacillus rossius redtenbacheri TaxID=93214 RepID=UPI002FDDCFAB
MHKNAYKLFVLKYYNSLTMYCKQKIVIMAWRNISRQCEPLLKAGGPRNARCCHLGVLRRPCRPGVGALRLASSSAALPPVPEPPPVPDVPEAVAELAVAAGEPSFASMGLGGWGPVGIVQNCLEYLHVDCGVPWWASIVIGTVVVRMALFPLVIKAQRNAAKMNNYMPQLQVLQMKMTEARETGNQLEAARYTQELAHFMKQKGLNPFKNMLVPLAQAPVFISFFVGLRGMTNVPVDSMRTGGLFWFTDLTVPDQYFILPIITSVTMYLTIELGTDGTKLSTSNLQTMRYVLRALPVCILPFTINFPGAILCYWTSTNFISLVQVLFLKIPAVREYFKIDPLIRHNPDTLPVKPKGFVEGIKDTWTNSKIVKELEDRRRVDELQFQRAGRGAVQKTYSFDPTKPSPTLPKGQLVVSAKKKE